MTRTTPLLALLLAACRGPASPSADAQVAARTSEEEPAPRSPDQTAPPALQAGPPSHSADRPPSHGREGAAESSARPEWRDDDGLRAHLRKAQGAAPKSLDWSSIVAEPTLHIDVLRSMWDDAEVDEAAQSRTYRVHLVVGQPARAHVVELALQERAPGYASLGPPRPPTIAETRWRGAGAEGPDLALTVSTASLWGTQCKDGQDDRRDLILCDVEAEALRCARVPLDLSFYDGCGGAEAYEGAEVEERCARVAFTSTWRAESEALDIRTHDAVDLDCLDVEADGSIGEPRPPLASPLGTRGEGAECSRAAIVDSAGPGEAPDRALPQVSTGPAEATRAGESAPHVCRGLLDYATLLDAYGLDITTLTAPP